ncbi:multifunctional acyl-CoA thioesterase I and protease I and lysophospholipase L1 [Clostridium ragsdalei P11]|uniref:Multifunctional acyl-CoA thioesterase I and protease I and lysophospholipase L1 n=1 Tax=Clostridium ragsdalei P11 TaxID=1353534 RepID=A0A1A6AJY8_9CLOT|nr:multifunctional acyl-CoA thioesterase I and protease I and lysophospholipase L1 [Clostridium ragsdalei P11]
MSIYHLKYMIEKGENKVSIVCIGDSITFGFRVRKTESWVSVLSKKIKENIINKGIPGNTTGEMKERFQKDVVEFKPSKVLIMGGTNDVFLKTNINDILKNIDIMVQMCEKNKFVPIVLTPLPVKDDIVEKTWFKDRDYGEVDQGLCKLRELLVEYGKKKNIGVIDVGTILAADSKMKEYFLDDGIHVSKEIHNEIAKIIVNSNIVQYS